MGFSRVRPYKIIYTSSIFRFLVSSKSLQSFILYTFNDIFQCQRLSTTLVIYVWMLWGWRLPLPRPLAAAQTKKKRKEISWPSRWDTWLKRWRSLGKVGVPAPRKSWVHFMMHGKQWRCHGWMPPLSSHFVAYFRILYFSLFFLAAAHWWQHQMGVVMSSMDDDRDGGWGSRWHFRVPRSANISPVSISMTLRSVKIIVELNRMWMQLYFNNKISYYKKIQSPMRKICIFFIYLFKNDFIFDQLCIFCIFSFGGIYI